MIALEWLYTLQAEVRAKGRLGISKEDLTTLIQVAIDVHNELEQTRRALGRKASPEENATAAQKLAAIQAILGPTPGPQAS